MPGPMSLHVDLSAEAIGPAHPAHDYFLDRYRVLRDHLGVGGSAPATCSPPAVALGATWNVDLIRRVGAAPGTEASAMGVDVLLGPGMNIKRSPLCGRNFEYVSEDPHVTARIAAALVEGTRSEDVGACVKHFAANDQETNRMLSSSDMVDGGVHHRQYRCAGRARGRPAAHGPGPGVPTRPVRELRGFAKVPLEPGQSARVESMVSGRDLST